MRGQFLDPPPAQPTTLDRLEAGFYGGTVSTTVAARMVSKISSPSAQDIIDRTGFDPSLLTSANARQTYAPAIAAIEFARRLSNLVDAINAAIDEQNAAVQTAPPAPSPPAPKQDAAAKTSMQDSKLRARLLYPDLKDPNSALAKKWTEVYEQMKAAGTLPDSPDLPFLISVRAANLLHIMPSAGQ